MKSAHLCLWRYPEIEGCVDVSGMLTQGLTEVADSFKLCGLAAPASQGQEAAQGAANPQSGVTGSDERSLRGAHSRGTQAAAVQAHAGI